MNNGQNWIWSIIPNLQYNIKLYVRLCGVSEFQTQLESKLSSLYRDLIHLHASMEEETGNDSAYLWTSCHVTQAARERLMTQVLKSCAQMKNCTSDLLELSILYPSAPWVKINKMLYNSLLAEFFSLQCVFTV